MMLVKQCQHIPCALRRRLAKCQQLTFKRAGRASTAHETLKYLRQVVSHFDCWIISPLTRCAHVATRCSAPRSDYVTHSSEDIASRRAAHRSVPLPEAWVASCPVPIACCLS